MVRRALAAVPPGAELLEVGTGQGAIATRLAERFDYTGVEADPESHATTAARLAGRGRLLHADYADLGPGERFDVVCAFEVLEHLEDDRAALEAWHALLRPGGLLLVSTPMHQHRFGPWDVMVGHYRRYSRHELADLLGQVNLSEVRVAAYGFPLGYALESARNVIARRRQQQLASDAASAEERTAASGRSLQPGQRLGGLTQAASAPFRLAQRPFAGSELGTGLVASGRKRE